MGFLNSFFFCCGFENLIHKTRYWYNNPGPTSLPSLARGEHISFLLIQAFIQTITPEEKDRLLLELLSNGRGSLDYAKNLITGGENDPNTEGPPETELPDWCSCGVCRPMLTPEEDKCCRKRVCVTSYELF